MYFPRAVISGTIWIFCQSFLSGWDSSLLTYICSASLGLNTLIFNTCSAPSYCTMINEVNFIYSDAGHSTTDVKSLVVFGVLILVYFSRVFKLWNICSRCLPFWDSKNIIHSSWRSSVGRREILNGSGNCFRRRRVIVQNNTKIGPISRSFWWKL